MTSVKISTTDELLAVLPHQLGYHLEECVVIAMVSDNVVGPVARTDLPAESDVARTAETLLESLLRVGPQLALLVGYESVAGESRSMLAALHEGLVDAGVRIIDHVVVRDDRWWGWCCRPAGTLTGLRPDHLEGHPMADDSAVPAVAEFIVRGSAPLASRDAVGALVREDPALSAGVGDALEALWEAFRRRVDPEGLLEDAVAPVDGDECAGACRTSCDWCDSWGEDDPEPDEEEDELDEEERRARQASLDEVVARVVEGIRRTERVAELWARVLTPAGDRGDVFEVSDEELARMVRSLGDKPWRDALIAWMSPVMFPLDQVDDTSCELLRTHVPSGPALTSERSETVLRRLLRLTPRVPDAFVREAAAICTVAACVAWGIGNGSTAGDAVTRALRVDPDYRLAAYLGQMIEQQMRPRHQWGDVAA